MDKEQIERANKFCFHSDLPTHALSHQDVHALMADFAAAEVARSRREIAAECKSFFSDVEMFLSECRHSGEADALWRKMDELKLALEAGEGELNNSASIGGNRREGGR